MICQKHVYFRSLSCILCQEEFPNRSFYRKHMLEHRGEKPFTCTLCGKHFTTKLFLSTHMTNVHNGGEGKTHVEGGSNNDANDGGKSDAENDEEDDATVDLKNLNKFTCVKCTDKFDSLTSYEEHLSTYPGCFDNSCKNCNKIFENKNTLEEHEKSCTSKNKERKDSSLSLPLHPLITDTETSHTDKLQSSSEQELLNGEGKNIGVESSTNHSSGVLDHMLQLRLLGCSVTG